MDPTIIISLAAFVGAVALVGAVAFIMRDVGPSQAENRLASITSGKPSAEVGGLGSVLKEGMVKEGAAGVAGFIGRYFKRFQNVGLFFEQADSPIKVEQFLLLCVGSAVLLTSVSILVHSPYPLIPIYFLIGGGLPWIWMSFRRGRRFKKFEAQLPDALELVARALRSGHSLSSGLKVVVDEMPVPVCIEFGACYEQQNLGVPIEQALKNMLVRMPNMDLKFFVTAVAIQRTSGGDLAEIIDKLSHLIRQRFQILGQVKALTGEGRISGVVLMALPIMLFFAVYTINPEYIMLLFTDPTGRKMATLAVCLQVVGAITIKKMVQIKV